MLGTARAGLHFKSVQSLVDNLAASVIAVGTDVVATMGLAGGWFN
jgi:hypothetical protein